MKQRFILQGIIIAGFSAFIATFLSVNVSASLVEGNGSGAGGSSVSGGGINDTSGYSWAYYKYVGGDANKNKAVTFTPSGSKDYGYSAVTIDKRCASDEYQGFYHVGYNKPGYTAKDGYYRSFSYMGDYTDSFYSSWWNGATNYYTVGSWGHFTSASWSIVKRAGESVKSGFNHELWKDGVVMFRATKSVSTAKALQEYNKERVNNGKKEVNSFDDVSGISYFCANDGATFRSKSTIIVEHDGTKTTKTTDYNESKNYSVTISGGSDNFTITGKNVINRSDGGGKSVNAKYQRWLIKKSAYSTKKEYTALKKSKSATVYDSSKDVTTITIAPGQSQKVCTKIKLWRTTNYNSSNGKAISYGGEKENSSQACITITHKAKATFKSNSQLTITSSSATSKSTKNGTETVESGYNKTTYGTSNPKVINFNGSASSATFVLSAKNIINRSDTGSGTAKVQFNEWNYSKKEYKKDDTASLASGKDKKITNDNFKEVTVKSGKKSGKICARIALYRSTTVTRVSGKKTQTPGNYKKPSSIVCITIAYNGSDAVDVPLGFIGEPINVTSSGGSSIYATFFADPSYDQTSASSYLGKRTDSTPHYVWETPNWVRSTPSKPSDKVEIEEAPGYIKAQYGSFVKKGSSCPVDQSEEPNFNINVPDDESYIGAKACVVGINRRSTNAIQTDHRVVQEREYYSCTKTRSVAVTDSEGKVTGYTTESYTGTCSRLVDVNEYKYKFEFYWDYSPLSCSPIAAKPNFRATNGNIYTPGGISGIPASKTNGKNYNSWAEYLVVANGTLNKFGSGAAFRGGNSKSNPQPSDYSQLSVANTDNSSIGNAAIPTVNSEFFDTIKKRFCGNNGNCTSSESSNPIIRYYSGDHTITASEDVSAKNNGNTQIIYIVDGNINIDPSVTTINAWLIASGTLNTCGGKSLSDINYDTCNNDLTINGVTYASSFQLYRTKVGTGNNSDRSAETFNLTPKVYSWTAGRANSYSSSSLSSPVAVEEVYTQELAPRL